MKLMAATFEFLEMPNAREEEDGGNQAYHILATGVEIHKRNSLAFELAVSCCPWTCIGAWFMIHAVFDD